MNLGKRIVILKRGSVSGALKNLLPDTGILAEALADILEIGGTAFTVLAHWKAFTPLRFAKLRSE